MATIYSSRGDKANSSEVLLIQDGSNTGNLARGEIWVSPEVLDRCGLPNNTEGVVRLTRNLGADICFLSCQGSQAVSHQAHAQLEAVRKVHAAGLACGAVVDGPWERLSRREGLLSLLSRLGDAPHIERELAAEAQPVFEEFEAWVEAGVDLILLADDIAHNAGPYISPAMFNRLLLPTYQYILSASAGFGIGVGFHSDGNLSLLLDDLMAARFSCFSLEPEAMSLKEFRIRYGKQITLLSGIRAEWLSGGDMYKIDTQDTFIELKDVIRYGNLILSSACGLSTPESVIALKEFYRLVDDLPL